MANLYRSPEAERRVRDWCRRRLGGWAVPHETSTLETSLGTTHLVVAGEGATVCVYLPGTNFNAATSLGLVEQLSRRCRVLAVDLPGQPGLSSAQRPRPEAEGYGAWLEEVVAAVRSAYRPERLTVVGHSRGAAVALAGPVTVDALALVSPAGLAKVRMTRAVLATALPWMLRPTSARSAALLDLMSGPSAAPAPDLVTWLTLVAGDTRSSGAPGPLPGRITDRWRTRPVTVLVGSHDCFFPAERLGPAARDRLDAPVVVLDGLGHLAVEEDPELVVSRLPL
ncbi:MAG TPA: alpha/beta hydrolase [Nocardioidaceae bacterium]|nr:alpha/beta hydrolase [Nocardioidaceae bacterium]